MSLSEVGIRRSICRDSSFHFGFCSKSNLFRGISLLSLTDTGYPNKSREYVAGIGGFFFRAKDPTALAQWYKEKLGVSLVPADYDQKPWSQEAGPTVFAPFPADSDYFGNAGKDWMINFRVRDLDAMVEQLRAAKIEVSVDAEIYPNGRFARLCDPEGNPIQLWEPK
jgi:predicted enzyme related to lactoylglutathione lyase